MKKKNALLTLAFLPVAFLILTSSSCRTPKKVSSEITPATEKRSVEQLKKRLEANAFRAKTMSAKLDLSIETDGQSLSATGSAVWIADSILWINVKKFGFEAARALITRDSFFMINRLEQTFFAGDLASLEQKFKLPGHFDLIEAMVLGNPWFPENLKWEADIFDQKHRLRGSDDRFLATFLAHEGLFKLQSIGFVEKKTGQSASLRLEDWRPVAGEKGPGGNFSYFRRVEIASPKTGRVVAEATLKDVRFNEKLSYRFEIPSHYKRAE